MVSTQVEHPLLAPHVARVAGGVDALMGLATPVVAAQLAKVVAGRDADAAAHPLTHPRLGPVLGRPSVAYGKWAVVGDVFNDAKAAAAVRRKLDAVAAACAAVSPYAALCPGNPFNLSST